VGTDAASRPNPIARPRARHLAAAALLVGVVLGDAGPSAARLSSLLSSDHGGHYWFNYCQDKDDDTPLPPDPRSQVTPTYDRAVVFNVSWYACMNRQPQNCGELRALADAGGRLLRGNGLPEAGWQFSGNQPSSMWSITANQYNSLWMRWGLLGRPANFDQVVAERYGTPLSAERNPYPLPGEDPNLTNGGSGQLPMALTQTRNADGSWTGNVGITCSICHSGQVGTAADGAGLGPLNGNNGLADVNLLLTEFGGSNNGFTVLSLNRVRGSGNITNFQLFGMLTLWDFQTTVPAMVLNPGLWISGTTGSEDPPNWWNLGHRPTKFYDAGMSSDSTRIELSWYMPGAASPQYQQGYDWIPQHEYEGNTWMMSLRSPAYPLPIDPRLARRGAVLFHKLDLWAPQRANPVRRPEGGNGSCASCHGAYARRYARSQRFLASPNLAGIAANVAPIDIINTDPARMTANSEAVEQAADASWFAYYGQDGCAEKYNLIGYLAQPLYGVWASAPYFHNGSVPTVWGVLDSSKRPLFWRRMSKPAEPGVVMGYETDLARAYDPVAIGWRYDELQCGAPGVTPYLECDPADPYATPLVESWLNILFANGSLAWNMFATVQAPTLTNAQIEDRKIYNTRMYSQSNTGHEFTDVLTDTERAALIEYLKTL
jgi:mono/diheme cytochrome c family protein